MIKIDKLVSGVFTEDDVILMLEDMYIDIIGLRDNTLSLDDCVGNKQKND